MYTGIKHLHSLIAYIALLLMLTAIMYVVYGWLKNKPFTQRSKTIVLLGLIAVHTQVLIGIVLYFLSPLGISNFSKETMSNSVGRLYMIEHPLIMLLGAVLITIGYSKAKRNDKAIAKYKVLSLFYLLGFMLLLSRVPWNTWL